MAKNSKIEWTDHTFNPWIGCTKVSPACVNCYAETLMDTRYGRVQWGKGKPRQRTSKANWKLPLKWNKLPWVCDQGHGPFSFDSDPTVPCPECEAMPRRSRVFCASLADWLDDEIPIAWLADLLDLIRRTPNLDWLLLTKRPEAWRRRMQAAHDSICWSQPELAVWISDWLDGDAPDHVFFGITVENQPMADLRIPIALRIPAVIRFLSVEPQLGPVDVESMSYCANCFDDADPVHLRDGTPWCRACESEMPGYILDPFPENRGGIHWVIAGGESGPVARPVNPDWVRSLQDQCDRAGIPFLFKQWGEWCPPPAEVSTAEDEPWCDARYGEFHADGKWVECCLCSEGTQRLFRLGKIKSGRLLDGKLHHAFPSLSPVV